MIVDSFLFAWELDLLEMRLYEMDSFVDKFILIESDVTFQGTEKPLYYSLNKERFKYWNDKIIHVIAPLPVTDNPWWREFAAREAAKEYINKFPQNTIVLHGDVDEIVSKDLGKNLNHIIDEHIYVIDHDFYSMAVDWKYPTTLTGTVIARNFSLKYLSMVDMRHKRVSSKKLKGGWHFTWLGGKEFIEKKAAAFSHTEDSVQNYIKLMGERLYTEGYHVLGEKLIPVVVDDSFPDYIKNNMCPKEWFR